MRMHAAIAVAQGAGVWARNMAFAVLFSGRAIIAVAGWYAPETCIIWAMLNN